MKTPDDLHELAQQLRVDSVRSAAAARSGHPTSSMSAADLVAVLAANHLRYDFAAPEDPANDHLIFSKGHASPLLYAFYKAAGAITDSEMLTFRQLGSRIEGHPTPALPWVDVATGSLGQGLPIAVGVALAGKRLDQLPYRVWVLCGDSEMAEGSMWEAFEAAAFNELDNLTAIIDVNRLGQRGETMSGWDLGAYRARAEAFGWHAIEVDGHDVVAIDEAYREAQEITGRPTVVIARTKKGKGVKAVEDLPDKHGKPLDDAEAAVTELGGDRSVTVEIAAPPAGTPHRLSPAAVEAVAYEVGSKVATRKAYGQALAALGGTRADVVALDGEVSNSTYAEDFKAVHPERFFEMYIAEQQLIAAAVGMQVRGYRPFASTFAAFLSRGYDFIRMAAISRATLSLCGSHAGVSIGEDGPSQMALEDIASLRAVHGSTVLYPSDGNSTVKLVALMADLPGISYLRTTRGATPVLYPADEEFRVGGSRLVRSSEDDQITVVAAGITLHEALAAAETLAGEGIALRVVDLYSVKPLDVEGLCTAVDATDGRLITVEDHWAEGGIGEAVVSALSGAGRAVRARRLAVPAIPGSGQPAELLAGAGIDAAAICSASRNLMSTTA